MGVKRGLTLREEHRQRVFENRVLRRIFGPKRDDVTREWRKSHNEELHNLYSFQNIIRACVMRKREEKSVQGFGGKAQSKETNRRIDWRMGSQLTLRRLLGGGGGVDSTGSG
jgi:hypothetical protein